MSEHRLENFNSSPFPHLKQEAHENDVTETVTCKLCFMSFPSLDVFVEHARLEHPEIYSSRDPEMSLADETHLNYYDMALDVKVEIEEDKQENDSKEHISPLEPSCMANLVPKHVNALIDELEDSPRCEKKCNKNIDTMAVGSSVAHEPSSEMDTLQIIFNQSERDSRSRATGIQFATLLEFMERHGDFTKVQLGARGRLRTDRLWGELVNILNSIDGGVIKTTDKWKRVWADWKFKTKKKALTMRRHANATVGGPNGRLRLTPLEARVLGIIGIPLKERDSVIEEDELYRSDSSAQDTALEEPQYDTDIVIDDGIASMASSSPTLPSASEQQVSSPMRLSSLRTTAPTQLPPLTSLDSYAASHRWWRLCARRRLDRRPFDRTARAIAAIQQRRLQLEQKRELIEARRLEVEQERNNILQRIADVAEAFLQQYLKK